MPIAVNELFDVAHLPAIYGSHALAGAVVSADAEVISALEAARIGVICGTSAYLEAAQAQGP